MTRTGGSAEDLRAAASSVATPTTSELRADDGSGESSFLRAVARASSPASHGPEPDRIGQTIGRYVLRARLGAGGMGVVYRADDPQLARPVALKVLRQRGELGAEQRRRFVREARAASAVRHPNVASVYEVGEHGDDAFIAMELLPGESLRARLKEGPLAIDEAVRITREVARALAAAHAAGVVHRDLKPDNVIVEPDGRIKVLDFGLARWTPPTSSDEAASESLTEEGMILGSPGYMSPEQVSGLKVDARSDYFALGVLLFELLTGTRPFSGATKMDVLVATSRDPAPPVGERRRGIPRSIQRLVAALLEKDPAARPASIAAILAALELEGRAGGAPTRTTVLGALVLGVAAAIAVVAWSRGDDHREEDTPAPARVEPTGTAEPVPSPPGGAAAAPVPTASAEGAPSATVAVVPAAPAPAASTSSPDAGLLPPARSRPSTSPSATPAAPREDVWNER